MGLVRTEQFDFEDIQYEIGVFNDGSNIVVGAYLDDNPVNVYSYRVCNHTRYSMKTNGYDAIKDLIETAKDDIVNKNWER
jgi:hypothetical protein